MTEYPNFEHLALDHKHAIETIWKHFPPYSDYNFISIYSYDTNSTAQICLLNGNLVLTMPDYITGKRIVSFIGTNGVFETVNRLLQHQADSGDEAILKLIPESTVKMLTPATYLEVNEDVDNHDYILDAKQIAKLTGNRWYDIKRDIRRFRLTNNYSFTHIDLTNMGIRKEMLALFDLWASQKNKSADETSNEKVALERSFIFSSESDHYGFGLYVGRKMVGYSINQIVHNGFYMGHFGKADGNYPGAYQIMEHECAKFFLERGCAFMNYEQDLGIPELRQAKRGWNPIGYLKKYTIKPK